MPGVQRDKLQIYHGTLDSTHLKIETDELSQYRQSFFTHKKRMHVRCNISTERKTRRESVSSNLKLDRVKYFELGACVAFAWNTLMLFL